MPPPSSFSHSSAVVSSPSLRPRAPQMGSLDVEVLKGSGRLLEERGTLHLMGGSSWQLIDLEDEDLLGASTSAT